MRVLFAVHAEYDPNAGAAGVICSLAEAYRGLGHPTDVLTLSDLPARLPGKAKQALFPWWLARRLRRDAARYDVVDAATGDGWVAFGRARRGGPLRVTHSHGLEQLLAPVERREAEEATGRVSLQTRVWRHGIRLREVSRSLTAADLCLVLNGAERDWLVDREGIAPERIEQVRYGTRLAHRPAESPDGDSPPAVVQIGSYTGRKGVDVTAAAMTPLLRRHPALRLRFLGTGVPRERVLADYPPDVHDQVEVTPRFDNADLPRHLEGAGIHLMPSRFEGFGVVKLESLACGLVPVVSDDPGSRAGIADGVNGLVTPTGDAPALASAVETLLADPALRARIAATGRAGVADWTTVAEERLDAYRRHAARVQTARAGSR